MPNSAQATYTVVERCEQIPPFDLVDAQGNADEAVRHFLRELVASDKSPATVKTYVYALLDWFRFLHRRAKHWRQAGSSDVRDYVLSLRQADNPYRHRRPEAAAPGSLNAKTGKATLAPGYKPATINHRLSVIKSFYAALALLNENFPNPVPFHPRRHAHHNPLAPWVHASRDPYRQREPKPVPRALPEGLYEEVFATLSHDRDRAILSLLVSSGCRAQELLGMTLADVDWGQQRVRLLNKGTREEAWVAASPAFFRWLAVYLARQPVRGPASPLWVTLRAPERALNYQALRAILNRINSRLGTNLTLHDFRHTCALRLASDPAVALVEVQAHMRHKHLSTTERYLVARPDEVVHAVHRHHQHQQRRAGTPSPSSPSPWQYDPADLTALLGEVHAGQEKKGRGQT